MTKFVMIIDVNMKNSIKQAREGKGMLIRELANKLKIDQALVSKFESGDRKPTQKQVIQLADILDLDAEQLLIEWLTERVLYTLGDDDELALKVMQVTEKEIQYRMSSKSKALSKPVLAVLKEIDLLKKKLNRHRSLDSYRIAQALELEYTFESNRIEGNTLTLKETDLVINEGLTISGKSMREHLEAVNHKHAIEFVKELTERKVVINERNLLSIHNLILRGIDPSNAGKYRNVQVMIKGSSYTPPQPFIVPKQMEDYFHWYQHNQSKIHPVLLAAEMSERLVTIHPFIDGNGRTSRLIMNLILLKHGYVIANIKGDSKSRLLYYNALEKAQVENDKEQYYEFIAQTELSSLKRYLEIIGK